uniref:Uncharacterized protein n=1 Tax=Parastrongyloides trichosuri TaxID=131310 RepID=A0A0N4ZEP8_PARTI
MVDKRLADISNINVGDSDSDIPIILDSKITMNRGGRRSKPKAPSATAKKTKSGVNVNKPELIDEDEGFKKPRTRGSANKSATTQETVINESVAAKPRSSGRKNSKVVGESSHTSVIGDRDILEEVSFDAELIRDVSKDSTLKLESFGNNVSELSSTVGQRTMDASSINRENSLLNNGDEDLLKIEEKFRIDFVDMFLNANNERTLKHCSESFASYLAYMLESNL